MIVGGGAADGVHGRFRDGLAQGDEVSGTALLSVPKLWPETESSRNCMFTVFGRFGRLRLTHVRRKVWR